MQTKLTTGMIPVVRLKSQADSESDSAEAEAFRLIPVLRLGMRQRSAGAL